MIVWKTFSCFSLLISVLDRLDSMAFVLFFVIMGGAKIVFFLLHWKKVAVADKSDVFLDRIAKLQSRSNHLRSYNIIQVCKWSFHENHYLHNRKSPFGSDLLSFLDDQIIIFIQNLQLQAFFIMLKFVKENMLSKRCLHFWRKMICTRIRKLCFLFFL